MNYIWSKKQFPDRQAVNNLSKSLNINEKIAQLLINRGVHNYKEAENFFNPSLKNVHNPFLFKQMDKAVALLIKALDQQQAIRLFGDYDVDGTTAVAMMMNTLSTKTSIIDYYIPDRYKEGYGLSQQGVDQAIKDRVSLFITLDCGIRSVDLIQQLIDKGIHVIVCDHHEPGEALPNAVLLDPKIPGESYPFQGLSGAGVGMKLLEALYVAKEWPTETLYNQLDLLALSIAADIVPVTDENRIYAYYGLQLVNKDPRPAFQKMLVAANRTGACRLNDLVFGIAPRINAAGRIRTGRTAVECMLTYTTQNIDELIQEIESDNQIRKALDQQITQEALSKLSIESIDRNVNIVYDSSWHKGVVGIVASRVIEKFPLPTIILTEIDGVLSGSARTVGSFDIHQALVNCQDLLLQFGGHQHAAGLSLPQDNFEALKSRLNELAGHYFNENSRLPILEYEEDLDFTQIFEHESTKTIPKLVRILERFEPFGPGNQRPVFRANAVQCESYRLLKDAHLKLSLKQRKHNITLDAIGFSMKEKEEQCSAGNKIEILYNLDVNTFNNQSRVQLLIKDIQTL